MSYELEDHFAPSLWPLLRLKPAFLYPNGIFSPLERLLRQNVSPEDIRFLRGRHRSAWKSLKWQHPAFRRECDGEASGEELTPLKLLQEFPHYLEKDIALLDKEEYLTTNFPFSYSGSEGSIMVHRTAQVHPMVHIDATEGPVVIGPNCIISAFCILKGPLFLAEGCRLDRVSISQSRVGRVCRLGGEIQNSLIGDFTNKHHEGFLGHSLVGDWVNLGALTTTSDLKNNYGEVRLQFRNITENTGTIKFGSIIGDFTKTAIGTMLGTGTVIDFGCLLYEGRPSLKYYPPFFWGGPQPSFYQLERFLFDIKKIMARRQQVLQDWQERAIRDIYECEFGRKS
ncbi:MAG: glucose-1-phosphate thymidylyltransferase [Leptospiraceae bacterium]|nr:glucose-1-phosphate thymidylyltransferase [Leptospiraceae bacterium]